MLNVVLQELSKDVLMHVLTVLEELGYIELVHVLTVLEELGYVELNACTYGTRRTLEG